MTATVIPFRQTEESATRIAQRHWREGRHIRPLPNRRTARPKGPGAWFATAPNNSNDDGPSAA